MHRAMFGMQGQDCSWGSSPGDCEVCMNTFDTCSQRPLSLPCGHSFCELCINTLTRVGQITCPSCRARHVVPVGGKFPINHTLESIVNAQRNAGGTTVLSGRTRSLLKDQETKIVAAINNFEQVHSQLDQYEASLEASGKQQQVLEGSLQKLMNHVRRAKNLLQEEKVKTAAKRNEVKQEQQELRTSLDALQTVTSEQEAGMAFLEGTQCVEEAQTKADEYLEGLSDDSATIAKEIMDASRNGLHPVQSLESVFEAVLSKAAPAGSGFHGPGIHTQKPAGSGFHGLGMHTQEPPGPGFRRLGRRYDAARYGAPQPVFQMFPRMHISRNRTSLKMTDVYSLRQPTRTLLEAGKVFAIHQVKGQWKCARMTLSGSRVCLHALQNQTLPAGAASLQMSEMLPLLPPCLVFLELSWPGSAPQRVYIRFSSDTPRARQFVLLCTGQWGPSYVSTQLFAVEDKGRPVERVKGGDYENNNGKGGATLLPGPDEAKYQDSIKAGSVWGCGFQDPAKGAQFAISTKQRTDRCVWSGVFGEVEQGLEVVAAAARHHNPKEVTVVDCGVVLRE